MTKYGQTTDYKASEHVKVLERYLGKNVLDFILVNSKNPKKKALSWYEEYGEHPVEDNLKSTNYKIIRKDLIKDVMVTKDKSDELRRSIIRHDSKKLASEVMNLIS